MSIQCHNVHSFKEEVILLCRSILETRRISDLYGSALFTIPLSSESLDSMLSLKATIAFSFFCFLI